MIAGIVDKIFGSRRRPEKPADLVELDAARKHHEERAENVRQKADDLSDILGNLVRNMKGPKPRCSGRRQKT